MTVWDVGGQDKLRPLWRHYYSNVQALIWVIDSCDITRLDEARLELQKLLNEPELQRASVLVLANKQDMPGALPCDEIARQLGLAADYSHPWHVQSTIATTGDGLYEGLDWMRTSVKTAAR